MDAQVVGVTGAETTLVRTNFYVDGHSLGENTAGCVFRQDIAAGDYTCSVFSSLFIYHTAHIPASSATLKLDINVVGSDTIIDFYINGVLEHSRTRIGYQASLSIFEVLTDGDAGTGAEARQLRTRWGDDEYLWNNSNELDDWVNQGTPPIEVKDGYIHSAVIGQVTLYRLVPSIAAGKLSHFSCADGTIHIYYSDTDGNIRLRVVQRSNGTQFEDFAITDGESDALPYAWQRSSGMQLYEECLFQRDSDIYHTYNPGSGIEGSWSEPEMAIAGYNLFAAVDIPPQGVALILMLLENPDTEVTEVYFAFANRAVDGSINWGLITPALVDPGDAFPTTSDEAQPEQGASLEFGLDGKYTLTWFDTNGTIYIAKSYDGITWGEV